MADRGGAADPVPRTSSAPSHGVTFGEAARFWIKLGFINFGGPTGQIAIMHDELVERRRWISNARYLHALNYCMLLPGPEAQQLAIYVGWLLHKVKGGIVAGVAFVLPAFFLMLGLSYVFVVYGDVPWVNGIFEGLGAAVVGTRVCSATEASTASFSTRTIGTHDDSSPTRSGFILGPEPLPVCGGTARRVHRRGDPDIPTARRPERPPARRAWSRSSRRRVPAESSRCSAAPTTSGRVASVSPGGRPPW